MLEEEHPIKETPLTQHDAITQVWEGHEDRAYIEEMSHWRGSGRYADEDVWQAIGKSTLKRLDLLSRIRNMPLSGFPTVLEWGPGGGSNAYAFRNIARKYFGIDISRSNLSECARQCDAEAPGVFQPVLLEGDPESVIGRVDQVDLFVSTAVFMHFPDKAYGERVLNVMRRCCKDNAMGVIQIRFDNDNPKFSPIKDITDYAKKHLTATSYRLDEFTDLCHAAGFDVHAVIDIRTQNNSAVFLLSARKAKGT